jgi:DNA-binding transcriptional LysR family regulator
VETVAVNGWLTSNHRDAVLDAVLAGEGIARMTDLSIRRYLRSGLLVPVLLDWESRDAPPVNLVFRPTHRRTPRVRVFVEFLATLFREMEADREERFAVRLSTQEPSWHRRKHHRASATQPSPD